MDRLIFALDLLGVAVFAATGALTASRKELDIVGFALLAAVTGIGGGTLRDLLIGRLPVFWVDEPVYLIVTTAVAVLLFFAAPLVESRYRLLLWLDALGMALFAGLGARTALDHAVPAIVAVLMGTMTATFGGLLRDIICAEVPLILRREIYVTAAALGAGLYVALAPLAGSAPALTAAMALAFAVRAVALRWGLSLPVYRARPGRPQPPG
ncbi:MAG: trimeric intracellular cation channel family protein [Geminicoccaceae bacterium]